jgi:pyrrolidone-carboxylate peptidase
MTVERVKAQSIRAIHATHAAGGERSALARRVLAAVGLIAILASLAPTTQAAHTRNVMLIGYWPPSNEMIRPFSDNPELNPDGWIGLNWENRGFNVYSYFPTFEDPQCTSCGEGMGQFRVDYQHTSEDFWPLVNQLQPVAIITFSRGNPGSNWEVEHNANNFPYWLPDFEKPNFPTPAPPDADEPAYFLRTSTLPMEAIVQSLIDSQLPLRPYVCYSFGSGSYLSGFLAYHGMWYQGLHAAADDPAQCVAAGHIHVGAHVPLEVAEQAATITVREVLRALKTRFYRAGDVNIDGVVNINDLLAIINAWGACAPFPTASPCDIVPPGGDGQVDIDDLLEVITHWDSLTPSPK